MSSSSSMPSPYDGVGGISLLFDFSGHFFFPKTNVTASIDDLPPAPVAWFYNAVDTVVSLPCYFANRYCFDWRRALGFDPSDQSNSSVLASWLSHQNQLPTIASFKPRLLTFAEFQSQEGATSGSANLFSYIRSWYQYAFFTSSTSLGDMTTPTALVVLWLLVLLLRQLKSFIFPIFGRIGYRMALRTHGAAWVAENEIRIVKFGEYVFRLVYHSVISIYGIYWFRNEVWWKDTIYVFRDYPHQDIAPSMAWYYLLQSAYNVDALFTLLKMSLVIRLQSIRIPRRKSSFPFRFPVKVEWSPDVRGDFQEMLIHHVVTNGLVMGSSLLRFTRIGSMVFLIHDISGM